MVIFTISRYCLVFVFLLLHLKALPAKQISSFSINNFNKDPNFDLFGDAQIVSGGESVKLNTPFNFSAGRLMYNNPIKFVDGNPRKPMSFSTYFAFSISPENGDGIAFVFLPSGFPLELVDGRSFGLSPGLKNRGNRALIVEFDTKLDAEFGDLNGNHVGIDVGGSLVSVRVGNVSEINLVLNNGGKLQAWISYDASSKRLEVRLSELGRKKPHEPLVSCPIDLSEMWKDDQVFVGISSSSGNSTQSTSVYSWSFWLRHVPTWLHSEPMNPKSMLSQSKEGEKPPVVVVVPQRRRNVCLSRIVTAIMFGTGCGILAVFILLFVKAMFTIRDTVVVPVPVPVEHPVNPEEFGYKKIKVVVKKVCEDGK